MKLILLKLNNYIKIIEIGSYKFNIHILGDFLIELNNYLFLDNYLDYCTICGNELEVKGLKEINICSNLECNHSKYQIVTDNIVSKIYKYDNQLYCLLIKLLLESISHPKASQLTNPIPKLFGITNFKDYSEFIQLNMNIDKISYFPDNKNKNINDIQLLNIYGSELYSLVKLSLLDNFFSFNTIHYLENNILNTNYNFKFAKSTKDKLDENTIHMIRFNYPAHIENTFNTSNFLFHGAPLYSWHYIIKNGLKVMSGTEFQSNGAVYGNGIYMSDDFNFSMNYSKSTQFKIIGIFEIKNNPTQYYKRPNIYVIPTEKDILLRYIIFFDESFNKGIELNRYFNTINNKLLNNKKNNIINPNSSIRLNKEYELLIQNDMILDIDIIKENINWIITIINDKYIQIKIELIFNDYPINPPTLKLIRENIKYLDNNNIIKIDNIIEIPEINPAKWTIRNNLLNLLEKINKYL